MVQVEMQSMWKIHKDLMGKKVQKYLLNNLKVWTTCEKDNILDTLI
jgi:hypothetical protein